MTPASGGLTEIRITEAPEPSGSGASGLLSALTVYIFFVVIQSTPVPQIS